MPIRRRSFPHPHRGWPFRLARAVAGINAAAAHRESTLRSELYALPPANRNSANKVALVGFFSKSKRQSESSVRLPPGFAQILEQYGRWEFDPQGSGVAAPRIGDDPLEVALYLLAQPDHDAFIRAVAAVAIPTGGWALYGGTRAVWNSVGTDVQHPDYLAMLDGSIEFIRRQGYGMMHLAGFEIERWNQTRGQVEEWRPSA
jgi:hypothetical protein